MTYRYLLPLLAAGAVGAGGCGNSGGKAEVAAVTPAPSTTATGAPNATKATTSRRAHQRAPRQVHVVRINPAPTGRMSGPTPVECLHQAGLTGAVAFTRDEWRATDPSSHAQVFVEGPYKTVAYAKASARSLRGVEISVRGGRYVVSALLTSGEGVKARLVANCLELATGRGTIKY